MNIVTSQSIVAMSVSWKPLRNFLNQIGHLRAETVSKFTSKDYYCNLGVP